MKQHPSFKMTNTIVYCRYWAKTVAFYRDQLTLPITFETDWFVEFALSETARLSIANERRATIKSCGGQGLTLSLQVEDADQMWHNLHNRGIIGGPIRDHPWEARAFYIFDPEGHRLEIWSASH